MTRPRFAALAAAGVVVAATLTVMWWLTGGEAADVDAPHFGRVDAHDDLGDPTAPVPRDATTARPTPEVPEAGGEPQRLDRAATVTLHGRVVDEHGEPIAGARVRVAAARIDATLRGLNAFDDAVTADGLGPVSTTHSDADGRWRLEPPDGAPWPAPSADVRAVTLLCFDAPGTRCVVDQWRGDPDTGTVTLAPGAWLIGRVVDEHSAPVAGARVWIRTSDFSTHVPDPWPVEGWTSVTTDAGGRFTTTPIRCSGAHLRIDDRCVPRDFEFGALVAGPNDAGDLVVWRGGVVTGVVRDAAGAAAPDARISIARDWAWMAQRDPQVIEIDEDLALHDKVAQGPYAASADASGAFAIHGVAHAELWVTASGPPAHGVDTLRTTLVDGAAHVELFLPPAASLDVELVTAEDGRPLDLDDVTLEAIAVSRIAEATVPGLEWTLHVGGPAPTTRVDRGRVGIWAPGSLGTKLSIEAPGHLPTERFVPAGTSATTIALGPCVVLEGRIADLPSSAPTIVTAHRAVDDEKHTAGTSDGGRFRFEPLTPGVWHLTTHDAHWERFGHITVDVTSPGLVDGLEIELGQGGAVRVEVVPPDARAFGLSARHVRSGEEVSTNARRFPALAPGTWHITGQGIEPVTAEVVAGETTTVEARAVTPPRVFGHVTSGGRPVTSGSVLVGDDFVDVAPDGTFDFVAERDGTRRIGWVDTDACWIDDERVELRWGETTRHDLALDDHVDLEVTVLDAVTGAPLADVPIDARTGTLNMPLGRTDAQGILRAGPIGRRSAIAAGTRYGDTTRDRAEIPDDAEALVPITLRLRPTGCLELRPPADAVPLDLSAPLTARFASTTSDEVVTFTTAVGEPMVEVPTGTWRLVAVPAWRDVDAVPPGAGTLVEIRRGERTTVEVPLSY